MEAIREFGLEQLLAHDELEMFADLHQAFAIELEERGYPGQVGDLPSL